MTDWDSGFACRCISRICFVCFLLAAGRSSSPSLSSWNQQIGNPLDTEHPRPRVVRLRGGSFGNFGNNPFSGFGSGSQSSNPSNPFSSSGNQGFGQAGGGLFGQTQQSSQGQQQLTSQPQTSSAFGGFGGAFGQGGGGGGGGGGLFGGQPQQQQQQQQRPFGSGSNIFGSSTIGSSFGSTGSSMFGNAFTKPPSASSFSFGGYGSTNPPSPSSNFFGQPMVATNALIGSGGGLGSGTPRPWTRTTYPETTKDNAKYDAHYMAITAMGDYDKKSMEELRWEDYQQGRQSPIGASGGLTSSSQFTLPQHHQQQASSSSLFKGATTATTPSSSIPWLSSSSPPPTSSFSTQPIGWASTPPPTTSSFFSLPSATSTAANTNIFKQQHPFSQPFATQSSPPSTTSWFSQQQQQQRPSQLFPTLQPTFSMGFGSNMFSPASTNATTVSGSPWSFGSQAQRPGQAPVPTTSASLFSFPSANTASAATSATQNPFSSTVTTHPVNQGGGIGMPKTGVAGLQAFQASSAMTGTPLAAPQQQNGPFYPDLNSVQTLHPLKSAAHAKKPGDTVISPYEEKLALALAKFDHDYDLNLRQLPHADLLRNFLPSPTRAETSKARVEDRRRRITSLLQEFETETQSLAEEFSDKSGKEDQKQHLPAMEFGPNVNKTGYQSLCQRVWEANRRLSMHPNAKTELSRIFEEIERSYGKRTIQDLSCLVTDDPIYHAAMEQHRKEYNRLFGVNPAEPAIWNLTLRTAQDIARANLDPKAEAGILPYMLDKIEQEAHGANGYDNLVQKFTRHSKSNATNEIFKRNKPAQINSKDYTSRIKGKEAKHFRKSASLPRIEDPDYYTMPSYSLLKNRSSLDIHYLERVANFTVGHREHGSVKFLGYTDVRGLDITDIVRFATGALEMYGRKTPLPPIGKGLNKPAIVTLLNVHPRKDHQSITKFTSYLRSVTEGQGATFITYEAEGGKWKMKVSHF